MKIFQPLFERAIVWAKHPRAPLLLTLLSFFEAIFFPVAPELMLAPMCVAQPGKAFRFAGLSLLGSMFGMFVGYAVGYYATDLVMPLIQSAGYGTQFESFKREAAASGFLGLPNGFWLLLIAGFAPVPFKIATLASGAIGMPLLPFFLGATIGRGKRVFLVAAAIRLGGEKAEAALRRHIEPVGWVALALLVGLIGWMVMRSHGA